MPGLGYQPQGVTGLWRGEKRVQSPETGCRTGRKLTGLGYAGAEDEIVFVLQGGREKRQ